MKLTTDTEPCPVCRGRNSRNMGDDPVPGRVYCARCDGYGVIARVVASNESEFKPVVVGRAGDHAKR